jgi:phage-related protein
MANKKIEVDVDIKGADKVKGLGQEIRELTKQLRQTPEGTKEWSKIYNQIDDLKDKLEASKNASKDWIDTLESAGGPLGMVGSGLNKMKVAFSSFNTALKASIIGLIVAALGGLVAAFRENEEAMKKLQPVMNGLQKILGGIFRAVEPLFDIFVNLATTALPYVTKAIGGVYAAFSGFFNFIKTYALGVGKILKGIFTLDFDSLKEGVSDLVGNFKTSWEAAKDTYGKFEQGTKEQTKIEKEEADKRAKNAKTRVIKENNKRKKN